MRRVSNPPNPWQQHSVEWLGEPPEVELNVWEEEARSILSENKSPDIPFRWSVNPYRGCFHGCAYCYARPTHQYLDFGAGTDFERQIVVKTNAPELLRESFQKKKWRGELVTFSGNTDCYQPLEATYQITRGCLEVCADFRNPVAIVTKGALVRRDVEVLQRLQRDAFVFVWVSIPWADDDMGHTIEPGCTIASQRFKTLRTLADAGIDCGVAVAPIIPGLNDSQIPEILERAAACGASRAFHILLRLPAEVKDVFVARLREAYPDRADKVLNALTEMRGGRLNDPEFGSRMRGEGPRWQAIRSLFQTHCRRLGLNPRRPAVQETTFQRPGEQLGLW
jgi:DNA repair photolyase